jgi:hypothetical protein
MNAAIAARRRVNQGIATPRFRRPADVVSWFGAMQAQEYDAARWGVGLRMIEGATDAAVARAVDAGRILRTHVMRPTWHFVAPADIRWLLALTAPRVHRVTASYNRRLGLDSRTLARGASVIERAVRDGRALTRGELRERLARRGFALTAQTLAHLVMYAELEGVVCSGPRRGKQFTYALLSERAPEARTLPRDEALAELATRFFRGHGPATVRDFVWWSGLTTGDARRGLEMIRARRDEVDGLTYWSAGPTTRPPVVDQTVDLLPIYDEYVVAYRDRAAVPHASAGVLARGRDAIIFQHPLVAAGQVAGTWRAVKNPQQVHVDIVPLRRLGAVERRAIAAAIARYSRFLESPVTFAVR